MYLNGVVLVTIMMPLLTWTANNQYNADDVILPFAEVVGSTIVVTIIRLIFQIHFIYVLKQNWLSLDQNRPDAFGAVSFVVVSNPERPGPAPAVYQALRAEPQLDISQPFQQPQPGLGVPIGQPDHQTISGSVN